MSAIERINVTTYVPTASPEADGTFDWVKTTLVLVEAMQAESEASDTPMRIRRRPF